MDAFLPRNAMHSDNYAACPSDWHYVETAKLIVKRFSPSGCHTILVFFRTNCYDNIPKRTRPTGASNARWYEKIALSWK